MVIYTDKCHCLDLIFLLGRSFPNFSWEISIFFKSHGLVWLYTTQLVPIEVNQWIPPSRQRVRIWGIVHSQNPSGIMDYPLADQTINPLLSPLAGSKQRFSLSLDVKLWGLKLKDSCTHVVSLTIPTWRQPWAQRRGKGDCKEMELEA